VKERPLGTRVWFRFRRWLNAMTIVRARWLTALVLSIISCSATRMAVRQAQHDFPRCHDVHDHGITDYGEVTVDVCGVPYNYLVTPFGATRVR
jgi:hypothetical protein